MSNVVEYRAKDGQMVKLTFDTIRKFLVAGRSEFVTQQELITFMGICKSRGLNPFARDCYLVKYSQNDNAAIIVSRGHYEARAKQQPDCRGWHSGIVVLDSDGKMIEREGHLILDDETLVGGWASAKIDGWDDPKKHTVPLKGYIKRTRDGRPTSFWSEEKRPMMIEKIAEVQLLRTLWSQEFAHLHVAEEIVQAEIPEQAFVPESPKERIEKIIAEPVIEPEPEVSGQDEIDLFWNLKEVGFKKNLPSFIGKYPDWPGNVKRKFDEKYLKMMGKPFGEPEIEPPSETEPEQEERPFWTDKQQRQFATLVDTKFGSWENLEEWALATGKGEKRYIEDAGGYTFSMYADEADLVLADIDGAKNACLEWIQSQ